jgi:AcrR family transcriptional regulator
MASREALIDAAVDALRQDGPGALTTKHLAARVGVVQSGFYRHFESIRALRAQAFERLTIELAADVDRLRAERFATGGEAEERRAFTEALVEQLERSGRARRLLERYQFSEDELGRIVRAARDRLIRDLGRYLESLLRGVEPKLAGRIEARARDRILQHARLLVDEILSVTRLLDETGVAGGRARVVELLDQRIRYGWEAFTGDLIPYLRAQR